MCTALGKEYTHFSRAAGTPSDVGYFEHRTWLILKCFAMEKNCIEETLVGRWQFKTNPRTTTKTSTETFASTAVTSWWRSSKVMMRRGRPTNSLTTNSLSNQSTVPQKVPAGASQSFNAEFSLYGRLFWTLFRHPGILKVPTFRVFTLSFEFFPWVLTYFFMFFS